MLKLLAVQLAGGQLYWLVAGSSSCFRIPLAVLMILVTGSYFDGSTVCSTILTG
jgi:hypothetical protein